MNAERVQVGPWSRGCSAYVASFSGSLGRSEWVMSVCEHKAVYNTCDKKLKHVKKINMLSKTEQNEEHFRASQRHHYGPSDVDS